MVVQIHQELKEKGIYVSKKRVGKLIKKHNLRSIVKRKYKATTDSEHKYPIVENSGYISVENIQN